MSKLIVVLVGVVSLAGCGNVLDPLAGSPNRLEVNQSLRVACQNFEASDAIIEAGLQGFESGRVGVMGAPPISYNDVKLAIVVICFQEQGEAIVDRCLICFNAMVDQVYDR